MNFNFETGLFDAIKSAGAKSKVFRDSYGWQRKRDIRLNPGNWIPDGVLENDEAVKKARRRKRKNKAKPIKRTRRIK